jgi:SOS response regulatory protein OraA/RecX
VLVVVSDSWRLAWDGGGNPRTGAGAAAEADSLRSIYSGNRDAFLKKVRLLLLPRVDSQDIPNGLHGVPRFQINTIDDTGLSELLRSLTGQPEFIQNSLGPLPDLPPNPTAFASAPFSVTSVDSAVTDEIIAPLPSDTSPGQRNALAKAREYLRYTAFSERGLVKQLASDGFAAKDAEYAVANAGAAWDEQAAKKAGDYLSHIAFSKRGLVGQLVSEGFTQQESERAVANVRADWAEQAVNKAESYLANGSFSQSGLASQLLFDGFTEDEAAAAARDTYQ